MRTITITTTLEDMKRWNAAEDKCCPIKHAIARVTGLDKHRLHVATSGFLDCESGYHYSWPTFVYDWIVALDSKAHPEPITFEMEIP